MTYSVSGKIQASDFNWFVDAAGANPENFNSVWSTGSGQYGFGQQAIPTVTYGSKVTASNTPAGAGTTQGNADYGGWAALADGIARAAGHTGASITTVPVPIVKNKTAYLSQIAGDLTAIHANKLNAVAQDPTTFYQVSSGANWTDYIAISFVVDFGTNDKARWFFNAGGQLKISATHPMGRNLNALLSILCDAMGEIWFSSATSGTVSLAGTNWNGVTKMGGTDPALVSSYNPDYGFHNWSTSQTPVIRQSTAGYSNHGYEAGSYAEVRVSNNGAGQLTLTAVVDEVPPSGPGRQVSIGTASALVIRPPSSSYLTTNWGTPAVSAYIIRDGVQTATTAISSGLNTL